MRILAVSDEEIGIDIEMNRSVNEGIVSRCFTEDEAEFAKQGEENYLRIWTGKEAVLKFLGTGFSLSPKSFSVLPLDGEHEINGRKIRLFCSEINEAPFTAAFCGNKEFDVRELLPEDLIY